MSDVIAGRIALLDPLARGASGSLWRAVDTRHRAICAAKVMRQRDGAEVLRFVREQSVRDTGNLGLHPHLLPPYTWVAEDDSIVLVMPLVHGGTLADALRERGPMGPAMAVHVLSQLLDALVALHGAGWVHRDIKPANLLFEARDAGAVHLLLADFGIALHISDVRLTETGMVTGTPGFMAPEARQGAGPASSADVWAAAACAVEMLDPRIGSGRQDADLLPRALEALRGEDAWSAALAQLLPRMLHAEPAERPSAAEALAALPAVPEHLASAMLDDRLPPLPPGSLGAGLPEIPLGGPEGSGLSTGLHDRLAALSAGSAQTPPGSSAETAPPPRAQGGAEGAEAELDDPTRVASAGASTGRAGYGGRRLASGLALLALGVAALRIDGDAAGRAGFLKRGAMFPGRGGDGSGAPRCEVGASAVLSPHTPSPSRAMPPRACGRMVPGVRGGRPRPGTPRCLPPNSGPLATR